MNLLLLLTALFASLAGAGSGDRALRQVQGVTMVQAAHVAQAAVHRSQRAIPAAPTPKRVVAEQAAWSRGESLTLLATYLPFERRLE